MRGDALQWWGLRVRVPADYEPEPLRKSERAAAGLLAGVALQLGWLGWLATGGAATGDPRTVLLVPVAIMATPLALALVLPAAILQSVGIEALFAISRESGELRRWDRLALPLSAAIVFAALRYASEPVRPALVLLAAGAFASSFCLAVLQPRVDFTTRRWSPRFPPWILRADEPGEIIGPDQGAAPVYEVALPDGALHPVGIAIPADVLGHLRKANRESGGRLYLDDPAAAILIDRDPVDGVGRDAVLRLCSQLASIAAVRGLTPFACANMVLGFVQDAIRYEYDEDSTANLDGGPFAEYGRFALETVHDRVGDCDCTTILCASLLSYLGFGTALIYLRLEEPEEGITHHVAVGLAADDALLAGEGAVSGFETAVATDGTGRRYLYGETAVDGSRIAFGGLPSEWKRIMKIEAVVPLPTPRHAGPAGA